MLPFVKEDYNDFKAAPKMESLSCYFNKKSLLLGCAVGAVVGLSVYAYKTWIASNGEEKVREKEKSALTRYR